MGSLAVRPARLRGARVFATASAKECVELVRDMGAHAVVDGRRVDRRPSPPLRSRRHRSILALAGGDALERCLTALRRDGRLALANGGDPCAEKAPPREHDSLRRRLGRTRIRNAAVQAPKLKANRRMLSARTGLQRARRLPERHVPGSSCSRSMKF